MQYIDHKGKTNRFSSPPRRDITITNDITSVTKFTCYAFTGKINKLCTAQLYKLSRKAEKVLQSVREQFCFLKPRYSVKQVLKCFEFSQVKIFVWLVETCFVRWPCRLS